jgi:GNAT superfamily N-acetyltransferase
MICLDKITWPAAYERYRHSQAFFPLIGAVLLGQQNGSVFADHPSIPRAVYVEHAFGFAQIFGTVDTQFDNALHRYLLVDRSFAATKVRLYTPVEPDFLCGPVFDRERSQRQRFILSDKSALCIKLESEMVGIKDTRTIDECFGVVRRFWRSDEDFCTLALPVVARVDSRPAAICYAAAIANGQAEIDVLTRPEYRGQGLGKQVVRAFCAVCVDRGLRPVWDCFTNNAGSMALAASCGFVPSRPAYPFYTLSK